MNLAEMLIYSDIEQLNRIAKHYKCSCNFHSKNELVQSILTSFHRQAIQDLADEELSNEVFDFLNLLVLDNREHYSLEELLAKAKQSLKPGSDMTERMVFIEGFSRGWFFHGYHQKDRYIYFIPKDVRTILTKRLGYHYKKSLPDLKLFPESYRDEGTMIVDDLVTFLQYVLKEAVQLTGDGSIYKRYQLQLFERFTTRETPIEKGGWRFGFGYRYPQYPDRFSLLYDYAIHNRLISESDETLLTLTEAGKEKLGSYIPLFEGKEIYRFWLRLYRKPIPNLPYIVKILHTAIGTEWTPVSAAKELVSPWLQEYYYETVDSLYENRIIQMLYYLGVIKKGFFHEQEMITFTNNGEQWIQGIQEEIKEIDFSEYKKVRTHSSRI